MPYSKAKAKALKRAVSDEDKEQRRRTILGAAKRVFARKGFHATTIADVAKAAKLSYGSIYWYFESKEALFHALMDSEQFALRRHVAGSVSRIFDDGDFDPTDPAMQKKALREGIRATFEWFESDRASAKLLFRESLMLGPSFEKHLYGIYERFIDDIEGMIAQGQEAGIIRPAPSRMVAFTVGGLIGQIAQRRAITDDGFSAEDVADFVVMLVLEGLLVR